MNKFWVAVVVLLAMTAGALWNGYALRQVTTELTARLDQATAAVSEGDWVRAAERNRSASDFWARHEDYLNTVLRHGDTEQVSTMLAEAESYIQNRAPAEYYTLYSRLVCFVNHLYESERLKLTNIL